MGIMKTAVAVGFTAVAIAGAAPAAAAPVSNQLYSDDYATEFVSAIQEVAWEFNLPPIIVNSHNLAPGVYAQASPGVITVSRTMSTDPAYWQSAFDYDQGQGFHKSGNCSAQRYVGIHEVAHQIDFYDGVYKEKAQVAARFGDGEQLRGQISDYSYYPGGGLNTPEALAEAFTAVKCGVATPTEHELYRILVSD